MKNISTGFGLCVAAAAALAYPFVSSLAPNANASAVTAAAAVSAAATGQATPTIVWYGVSPPSANTFSGEYWGTLFRAWSDGKIEYRFFNPRFTGSSGTCAINALCEWQVFSTPSQGLTFRSDINFDEKVDGADLGVLLGDWGNAPRQGIPPSDCPLALINP